MRCPVCQYDGGRGEVHRHLAEDHPDGVEMWTESGSGRMRYRVECPVCGEAHEARVKPRSHDPAFLKTFAREIRLVAFDMLLNHIEAEHGAPAPGEAGPGESTAGEPAPRRGSLPAAGPAGGRGRPGADGVPLPPGMDEPDLPPWALKITHSGSET